MWLIRVLSSVLVLELAWSSIYTRITLKNNGYEGLVVGISPTIPEDKATEIIDGIKDRLTAASKFLFSATHRMMFFKDIKILLPKSWENTPYDEQAMNERYEKSDIRVDDPHPVYMHQVYTDQPGLCGEPGEYIHVTPEFTYDDRVANGWGPYAKVLTKEWARLRWGVFDEVGYPKDDQHPLLYTEVVRGKTEIRPTTCTNVNLVGRFVDKKNPGRCKYNGTQPDENCRFIPDARQNVASSLMGFIYIPTMEKFCDYNQYRHNSRAPTRQNLMCSEQSVWEIIYESPDFINLIEAPPGTDTTPKFTVVREGEANFAFVLDYSGSMSGSRIQKLQMACRRWLLHDVAVGSSVGVITFSDDAAIIAPMTEIVDDASRRTLADSITTDASGGTCIGCGLRKAVSELLKDKLNKVILLLSDGKNNRPLGQPLDINSVKDEVVASGAQVLTIAFGDTADKDMEQLALSTSGKSFTVYDNSQDGMLDDAFRGALTYQPGNTILNSDIKIFGMPYKGSDRSVRRSFVVDATLGRNLQLRLDANTQSHVTSDPVLTSPSGTVYDRVTLDQSNSLWIIDVRTAETGTWTWSVGLSGNANNNIRVSVTAQAKDPKTLPIRTEAWMSAKSQNVNPAQNQVIIYARVTQGTKQVVGAKVRAYVSSPDNTDSPDEVDLRDNGQGADVQKGDGIYSRYFTKYTTKGRYSVKAQVWDDGNTFINNGIFSPNRRTRRSANDSRPGEESIEEDLEFPRDLCCGSVVPSDPASGTPTGQFTRISEAGSMQVTKYPPLEDYIAPCRIRDLQLLQENLNSITLTWTAPGDDLDTGTVSGYEIRMSTDRNKLQENSFDGAGEETLVLDQSGSKNVPGLLLDAGETVLVTVNLKASLKPGHLYYIAIRALDDANKKSNVSNMVTLVRDAQLTTSPEVKSTAPRQQLKRLRQQLQKLRAQPLRQQLKRLKQQLQKLGPQPRRQCRF